MAALYEHIGNVGKGKHIRNDKFVQTPVPCPDHVASYSWNNLLSRVKLEARFAVYLATGASLTKVALLRHHIDAQMTDRLAETTNTFADAISPGTWYRHDHLTEGDVHVGGNQ